MNYFLRHVTSFFKAFYTINFHKPKIICCRISVTYDSFLQTLLIEFSCILFTRWNLFSSGVIYSKILPFNCSVLFLSYYSYLLTVRYYSCSVLSCITWLICIRSWNNSLPVRYKINLLCSVLILLFSCRSFGRILLWWQRRENRKWLV